MCLIELCFVSAIYINGSVGVQPVQLPSNYDSSLSYSNDYKWSVGELSGVIEFTNGMYIEVKHISGLDAVEDDYGLNAIMIGAKIYLFKGNK
jgi:hypothetical protein